jgi:type II secretory pathway component PulF
MTPLETKKQLLLTESELNRAQLIEDLAGMQDEIHRVADQVRPLVSLFSSATTLATTFTALRRTWTAQEDRRNGKRSWISSVLHSVQSGAALWQAFRSRPPEY